jgi:hypothetical protein
MAVPRKDDSAPSAAATMAVPRKDDSAPSAAGTMAVPRRDEPDPSPATTAFARTESPAATTGATRTAPASDALLPRSTAPAVPPSTAELAAIAVGSFLAVFAFGLALAYWLR